MNLQTVAAVDVGSNAVRCLISDVSRLRPDRPAKKSAYLRIPLRLGADVFARGRISDEKKALFREAMQALAHLMRAYSVDHYRICATSAMRDAANGLDLLAAVKAAFEAAKLEPEVQEVVMKALNETELTGADAEKMQKLLDMLESLDDVQAVYSNAELPA